MKKPDKTRRPDQASAADQPVQPQPDTLQTPEVRMPEPQASEPRSPGPQSPEPSAPRKAAAEPGAIASAPIPPGDGAMAAATGAEVRPVKSTLLGDATGQHPPAARKSGMSDPASADLPQATPFGTGATRTGAPGDRLSDGQKRPDASAGDATPPAVPDAAPAVAASVPPPARPAPQGRKTGFWPVVLGGVVAAGLGSAATIWALPRLPAGWLPENEAQTVTPAPEIDLDALRAEAVAAAEAAAQATAQTTAESTAQATAETVVDRQIAALREELAAQLATAPAETDAPPPSSPAVVVGTAPDEAPDAPQAEPAAPAVSPEEVAALRDQLDQQAARIQELIDRPQIDPALAERVEALAGQADTLEQQIQTAAQAAQAQINEAQAEAERLQQAAAESTRRAEAVAAVAALQSALDRGVSPDEAQQALAGAGLDTPEALTRAVPSLDSLQAGFPEAARAALRTTLREDSAAGEGNVIANFLRAQTGARSVAPREGDDPDAVLSRADAAVEAGRIADAVAEIEALPEPARAAPAMAEWLAGATAYRDAQAALSDLSAPSN